MPRIEKHEGFTVGDLVGLKSGGPVMTLANIDIAANGTPFFHCEWFAGKKSERHRFTMATLKHYEEDSKKKVVSSVDDIAKQMLVKFESESFLAHLEAVDIVMSMSGEKHIRENINGNVALTSDILKAFRSLTEGVAVWMKSERAWRAFDPLTDDLGVREQPL